MVMEKVLLSYYFAHGLDPHSELCLSTPFLYIVLYSLPNIKSGGARMFMHVLNSTSVMALLSYNIAHAQLHR